MLDVHLIVLPLLYYVSPLSDITSELVFVNFKTGNKEIVYVHICIVNNLLTIYPPNDIINSTSETICNTLAKNIPSSSYY